MSGYKEDLVILFVEIQSEVKKKTKQFFSFFFSFFRNMALRLGIYKLQTKLCYHHYNWIHHKFPELSRSPRDLAGIL